MIKQVENNSEYEIKDIKFGKINITKIITNSKIVWQRIVDIITGVFNSGVWISTNIWNGNEFWKNQ